MLPTKTICDPCLAGYDTSFVSWFMRVILAHAHKQTYYQERVSTLQKEEAKIALLQIFCEPQSILLTHYPVKVSHKTWRRWEEGGREEGREGGTGEREGGREGGKEGMREGREEGKKEG